MTEIHYNTPRRRQSPTGVVAHRQALLLVKPFMNRFEDWNQRAAYAGAAILSLAGNPDEQSQHLANLAALRDEIETSYVEFKKVTTDQPRNSRIDDVANAFERLLSVLKARLLRQSKAAGTDNVGGEVYVLPQSETAARGQPRTASAAPIRRQ